MSAKVIPINKDNKTKKASFAGILHDWFISSFPVSATVEVNDLAVYYLAVPVAALCHAFFIALFGYFCYINTMNMVSEKFLAPSDSVITGSVCEPVLTPWQATFNMDSRGQWSSSASFQSNASVYELQLGGIVMSEEEYRSEMRKMYADFEELSTKTAAYDYSYGIAALASYRYYSPRYRFQFYPHVDVRKIFNRQPSSGMIANAKGSICLSPENPKGFPKLGYAAATGTLSLTYEEIPEENTEGPCSDVVNAWWYFSYESTKSSTFKLEMDVVSIQLAVAINFGVIRDPANAGLTQVYGGLFADMGVFYVDEFYQDMKPIFCLHKTNATSENVCFLYFGNFFNFIGTFMYPMIGTETEGLECPDLYSPYGLGLTVGGVLLPTPQDTFEFGIIAQRRITEHGLPPFMYNMSVVMATAAYTSLYLEDRSFSAQLRSFCGDSCTLAMFQIYWVSEFPPVNQYYVLYNQFLFSQPDRLQLVDPVTAPLPCQNVVFDAALLQIAAQKPPQQLQESYKVCRLTTEEAFQRAVGIAVGNAGLYGSLVSATVIFVLVYFLNNCRLNREDYAKKVKSKKEKEELHEVISKTLALSTLNALQTNGLMQKEEVQQLRFLLSLQCQPSYARFRGDYEKLGIPDAYLDFPNNVEPPTTPVNDGDNVKSF